MPPAVNLKTILLWIAVVTISFFVSLKTMDWLWPRAAVMAPALVELPPLPSAARSSSVLAEVGIALSAIRDAADRGAPRAFAGKADNPVSQILQNADIGWTASRGAITATGAQDVLSLATPLTGALNVTGSLSSKATGAVNDALGGLLGVNVPAQVKPLIDKAVADQLTAVQARIRNDPALEQNARAQWAKACRSIPLQGNGANSTLPPLWLEVRPVRAIAIQPRVDAQAITVTVGVEAETRITSTETKPDCPFPDKISIIPPMPAGVSIGVPIDLPFTDINKMLETQFAGKTFPEDGSGSVALTVKQATVAASANRLLISLFVHAKEKKSWFGLGADATIQIWGRPTLDPVQQTLRLTDVQLAVESDAALGLLGAAAREAVPHLQQVLADKAVLDLKPFAANAQKKIAAAIADYEKNEDGVRV